MKLKFLLIIIFLSFYQLSEAQVPTEVLCNSYQIQLVNDYGCGNFKFRKDCDLETIWEWGDGTSLLTSKEEFVMHKFCKAGRYLVTIKLKQSPSIIRNQLYVDVYDDATLNYTYTILSQIDCDKSVVKFESFANCIESYDLDGILIPGSDQIMWDFGDGTTSTDLHPKHTFTSGGNFHVTLQSVSSPCELETQKVVPLGDPVTCCLDNVVFNYNSWQPIESVELSGQTIKVKNLIRVKPGVELKLTGVRLEMGKDAKIIVERGASLILENSVITTTSCGGYVWEGIEVWGSGDGVSQSHVIDESGSTGNLYVSNTTIENADEAITVARKRSLAFFDIMPKFNGGYINVTSSTFKNNYTSINIWPYKDCSFSLQQEVPCNDCGSFKNFNTIDNNTFICNAPMRDEKYSIYVNENSTVPIRAGMTHFIYINGNYAMFLGDNIFINNYLTPPVKFRGTGIVSVNSGVYISNVNLSSVNRFRGLTTGIRATANNTDCQKLTVRNYNFAACQTAIDANSTLLDIANNQISIPNTVSPLTAQGIHVRNCRGFEINQNNFNGISVGNKYGILMRNDRIGTLKNNQFNNLHVGSQSELLNNSVSIDCNLYNNQNYSITVPNGRIKDQGTKSIASGNKFIDGCKAASSSQNHIKSNVFFKYFYIDLDNQNPFCKSSIVSKDQSTNMNVCISLIPPPPPCEPTCTKDIYVQNMQTALLNNNQEEYKRLQLELRQVLLAMEGGFNIYKTYLDDISSTDLDAAMVLAGTYLNEGKTNELSQLIDRILNFDNEEANSYAQLMKVLQQAYTENRALHELNDEEVLVLNDLAMNDTTNASYIAEGILYQLYDYDYNHNPMVWNDGNRVQKEEEDSIEEFIILPNPAKDWLTIKLDNTPINSLYIYNILGELVYEQNSILDAEISIDASTLSKGLYTVKVKTQEKLLTQKLLIE